MNRINQLTRSYKKNLSAEGGFLPKKVPNCELPAKFEKYFKTINNLYLYYPNRNKSVRTWMNDIFHSFNLEDEITKLSYWKKNKLLTVVTILCHAYRWDNLPPSKIRYEETSVNLPKGLEAPLILLSKLLNQPPCGSLWNTTICNWKIKNKLGGISYKNIDISMNNIEIAHTWFNNELHEQLEKWILIFVISEAKGAPIINKLVSLIQLCELKNDQAIIEEFKELNIYLAEFTRFFNEHIQFKKLDVKKWRSWIQPTFIWGLKSKDGELLEGASGLQLGITQCLDIALGVNNDSKIGKALKNSRKFMPTFHRQFLYDLEACKDIIRQYVLITSNTEIKIEYNKCLKHLSKFRKSHKIRGKEYIKGDHTKKTMTTTGLSIIAKDSNLMKDFEELMDIRINDTENLHI